MGNLDVNEMLGSPSAGFTDLKSAVCAMIESGLDGRITARATHVDAVITGSQMRDRRNWRPVEHAAFSTALSRGLLYSARIDDALKAAEQALALLRQISLDADPRLLSRCTSLVAQTHLLAGDTRQAGDLARIAADQAVQGDDDTCAAEAQGILAAALAINGEFYEASCACSRAMLLSPRPRETAPWPVILARVFTAGRTEDVTALESMIASIAYQGSVALVGGCVRALAKGRIAFLEGDYQCASANMDEILNGVMAHRAPRFVHSYAHELKGLALLQLGDTAEALRTMQNAQPLPHHSVCAGLVNASAQLLVNRPREALRATDECRHVTSHSLRTYPGIYLRRALAFEMLGQGTQADREFSRAAHLAMETAGMMVVPVAVPPDPFDSLLHRLSHREPEFSKRVRASLSLRKDHLAPMLSPTTVAPLTSRELDLANWLTTELTIPEISDKLYLSVNTVKTELRRLYKKVGASSRQGAVDKVSCLVPLADPRRELPSAATPTPM
ncbi:regulatory protein, luxR family [Propionibacterium cyclohexanicum]|uniref:Regulatory protein, luxR family n=2 Tax=Propionibacterium cyclohexanicum TaxID=64702 RepID=A0A1H9TT48_9ACTN|nr:regulatory protein, luxR family [Propionibacterium cyclohexanicum]